jgi:hypothetical protein
MVEEYGWSVTQAARWGRFAADRVPMCLELGFQLDALVGEKSPYTKHCAIVVSHNSLEITYVLLGYVASVSVRAL